MKNVKALHKSIKKIQNLAIFKRYSSNRPFSSTGVIVDEDVAIYEENLVKSYNEIPGPRGLPVIGNSWRFAPLIGKI